MSGKLAPGIQVVAVRYAGDRLAEHDELSVDVYAQAKIYETVAAPVSYVEPRFPEDRRTNGATENLGLIGGEIANAVAQGRAEGKAVVVVGGTCALTPGVLGGLQDAHGPAVKIGLVWFDAHGDFNTPKTTLSGMLGGMPVAVAAGLAHPRWRELSHMRAALPTDRILMVDVRNLDEAEQQLIQATDIVIAAPADGFPGVDLQEAVADLASRCGYLYLHIDSDILDERFVPNHGTREPNGPDLDQVKAAIDLVMATGKVIAFAVVSVFATGEGYEVTQRTGIEMIEAGLASFEKYGISEVD